MSERTDLADLFENGKWYHCIRHEGLTSNGVYDIESHLASYALADSYAGKSVLDVGCADGYFSLLAKERGAARVCGVDSNKYDGSLAIEVSTSRQDVYEKKYRAFVEDYARFRHVYSRFGLTTANKLPLVAALKKLDIEYRTGTIYDLVPFGHFDVVFCNDLLEHLRDPITAIEQVAFVTRGMAVFSVSSALKLWFRPRTPFLRYQGDVSGGSFYQISAAAVGSMCRAAGFRNTRVVGNFNMVNRQNASLSRHCVVHAFK